MTFISKNHLCLAWVISQIPITYMIESITAVEIDDLVGSD